MSGSHRSRWITLLVFGALTAFGCVGTSDTGQQGETGSLSVDLVLADGIEIDEVGWAISGNDMDMSGNIDVSAPGSTASVEVFGLPPGEGYTVTLTATSTDEAVTCEGSAPFSVEVGQSTEVMVMLNCKKPRTLGGVRVNGEFNICTQLTKATAAPLETSVGNDIALTSQAEDAEMDPIAYDWTATSGSLDDPSAASTTYTCTEAGAHFITISVTDNDEYCDMATWTFPVTCVPGEAECMTDDDCDENEVCDAGQCVLDIECVTPADCDDENDCTANICADGTCANPNSDIDEMCDQDGGSVCDGEGACVACNDDTQCDMGEVCIANECVADVECMENDDCGVDEICVVNTCVGDPDLFCNEGLCATNDTARMNCVEAFLVCLEAEPANEEGCLVLGLAQCNVECLEDNDCEVDEVCTNNECVADVQCMMDSQCDDGNDCTDNVCTLGECMNPNTDPDEMCNQDGGSVCDGLGACVECNASDQCPDAGECQVPICVANTCAQNNVMNGQVCDFSGSDGICEDGTCIAAPECVSPGDCNDGNPCTVGDCPDGMCVFTPVDGGTCEVSAGVPGTCGGGICVGLCVGVDCTSGSQCVADGTCDDQAGSCVAGANEPADAVCSENGGSVCDGDGNCVECNVNGQCDVELNETCVDNECVAGCTVPAPVDAVGIPMACRNSFNQNVSTFPIDLLNVTASDCLESGTDVDFDIDPTIALDTAFLQAAAETLCDLGTLLTQADVTIAQVSIDAVAGATCTEQLAELSPVPQTVVIDITLVSGSCGAAGEVEVNSGIALPLPAVTLPCTIGAPGSTLPICSTGQIPLNITLATPAPPPAYTETYVGVEVGGGQITVAFACNTSSTTNPAPGAENEVSCTAPNGGGTGPCETGVGAGDVGETPFPVSDCDFTDGFPGTCETVPVGVDPSTVCATFTVE